MLYRNMNAEYYSEVSPEGDAGGGAPGAEVGGEEVVTPPEKTYTQTELDALTGGMRGKLDELLGEKKAAALKAKESEAARVAAEQESARKTSDIDKFEQSLRGELAKEKEDLTTELATLKGGMLAERKKIVLGSLAKHFEVEGAEALIGNLIQTEFDGSEIKTKFLDFDGNLSTTDADEFVKLMAKHKVVSHLMKADNATGGGATGAKSNAGGVSSTQMTRDDFDKLSPDNRMKFVTSGGKVE